MELNKIFKSENNLEKNCYSTSMLEAGTGCMISLSQTIRKWENRGYIENLVPCFDHFSCRTGQLKLIPENLKVDKMIRFENASDPSDQAILYAISSAALGIKGLYIDSYGFYHDDLAEELLECLKDYPA